MSYSYYKTVNDRIKDIYEDAKRRMAEKESKKVQIIYHPPKKTVEEQRLRPKFRRSNLGKITIWTKGMVNSKSFNYTTSDNYEMKIEVEGEEGFGEVPITLIKKIQNNEIIVETLNDFVGMSGSYYQYRARGRSGFVEKMSLRRFLYECVVYSQYIEFEEL